MIERIKTMKKKLIKAVTILLFLSLTIPIKANDNFNEESINQIEGIIKNYILNNPEIILESVEKLRDKQAKKAEQNKKLILQKFEKQIYSNDLPFIGSKNPEIVLVEFVDYNCGYCKKTLGAILTLVEQIPTLKVILRDYPILAPSSELAARAALAADKQGRYLEFHQALLTERSNIDINVLIKVGKELGLDTALLEKDMNSKEIYSKVAETTSLAQSLDIRGTPTFIIGDKIVPGALDINALKNLIESHGKN